MLKFNLKKKSSLKMFAKILKFDAFLIIFVKKTYKMRVVSNALQMQDNQTSGDSSFE